MCSPIGIAHLRSKIQYTHSVLFLLMWFKNVNFLRKDLRLYNCVARSLFLKPRLLTRIQGASLILITISNHRLSEVGNGSGKQRIHLIRNPSQNSAKSDDKEFNFRHMLRIQDWDKFYCATKARVHRKQVGYFQNAKKTTLILIQRVDRHCELSSKKLLCLSFLENIFVVLSNNCVKYNCT